jgi:Flp pilus assembly pilin Flp
MNLLKRLCQEDDGQGLMEYTLVVVLVALVFWLGVKDTSVGDSLATNWAKILDCVTAPFSCSA